MADLIWRCSSTFSNNKQSHHDATAIVKVYPCVSQLHKLANFITFHYFSIFAFIALPRQKKWWNLDSAYNSELKNVTSKVRQIALVLPIMLKLISTLLGVILVDVLWSVLSYGGEPPTFLCRRKPEKEKTTMVITISFVVFRRTFAV